MANSRLAAFLAALSLLLTPGANAHARKPEASPASARQRVLSLDFRDNGQHVAATVGQQVDITLGTVGGGHYGDPQVSSPAIRFEDVALAWPPNPGGPRQIFIFEAAAQGEAQVGIPHTESTLAFAVTIQVGLPPHGKPPIRPSISDQANTAAWTEGTTNLLNDVRQTFTPSLPRLTGVEAELVVANPGPPADEVTMTVENAGGDTLALISKTVSAADSGDVLFVFPGGGLEVSPGQVYSIGLRGGSLFGWKYVVGGYRKGQACFNGKPLLRDARSTFLFRTFGNN